MSRVNETHADWNTIMQKIQVRQSEWENTSGVQQRKEDVCSGISNTDVRSDTDRWTNTQVQVESTEDSSEGTMSKE